MISAPPATLAHDALVPQRDLLLDPAEVARRLATALGPRGPITIGHCERTRAKYRVGDSLRALYEIEVDGTRYAVSARTFRDGRSAAVFRQAVEVAAGCGPLRPLVHDADLDTVFWVFPNDRRIRHLTVLAGDSALLARLLGRPCERARVVAYAPEKAATAACLNTHHAIVAYAKVYAGDDGARGYAVHRALARSLRGDQPELRIPGAIVYSAELHTLVVEPIEGRCLAELDGLQLTAAARRVGVALAGLHTAPPPDARRFSRLDVDVLHEAARLVGLVRPDVRALAEGLARDLASRWEEPAGPPTCLHGDVNFRNWIVGDRGVGLVDLDSVSAGPSAADLGSLLSSLRYRHRVGRFPRAVERRLAAAVLAGYASVRDLPSPRLLRWHTAAALLTERVLRAVTRLRPEALPYLDVILTDARQALEGIDDA